jgi:hypothetical protein
MDQKKKEFMKNAKLVEKASLKMHKSQPNDWIESEKGCLASKRRRLHASFEGVCDVSRTFQLEALIFSFCVLCFFTQRRKKKGFIKPTRDGSDFTIYVHRGVMIG